MAESAIFVWEGTDKQGKKTTGEITSSNPAIAKAELRRQGIVATRVRKKSKGFSLGGGGKPKPADIALFTRQLSTRSPPPPQPTGGQPSPDGSGNVLDGLILELHDFDVGDVFSANWFFFDGSGNPVGVASSGTVLPGQGWLSKSIIAVGVKPRAGVPDSSDTIFRKCVARSATSSRRSCRAGITTGNRLSR